jgi:putative oxidoreductase
MGLTIEDVGKLILRVGFAGLLLCHGIHKLLYGVDPVMDQLEASGLPRLMAYGSLVGEVAAPLLVLVGLFTRPAAAVMALTMVTAGFVAFRDKLFELTPVGAWALEPVAVFFVGSLAICLLGAGRFSLSRGKGRWWR